MKMRPNPYNSTDNPECAAFVAMLETLRIPFTWYTGDGLRDRYQSSLDKAWWGLESLGDFDLIGIELGSALVVFESKSGRFVLVDSMHGKPPGGSFVEVMEKANLAIQLRQGEQLEREDEFTLIEPDRNWRDGEFVTPHEVQLAETVTSRIESWICSHATTIMQAQHGYRDRDEFADTCVTDISVHGPSEDMERSEYEVYFAYEVYGKKEVECWFPARYMWSKDWREQLKADTAAARKARHDSEVKQKQREVKAQEARLAQAKRELSKLEGGES